MRRSDEDSIFGYTYQGVPNPQIPYTHPYPTRYHGPIFTEPRFGLTYQANPMAVAPYSGADGRTDESVSAGGMALAVGAMTLAAAGSGWLVSKLGVKSPAAIAAAPVAALSIYAMWKYGNKAK